MFGVKMLEILHPIQILWDTGREQTFKPISLLYFFIWLSFVFWTWLDHVRCEHFAWHTALDRSRNYPSPSSSHRKGETSWNQHPYTVGLNCASINLSVTNCHFVCNQLSLCQEYPTCRVDCCLGQWYTTPSNNFSQLNSCLENVFMGQTFYCSWRAFRSNQAVAAITMLSATRSLQCWAQLGLIQVSAF